MGLGLLRPYVEASFALRAESVEPDSPRARELPDAIIETACGEEAPCRISGRWIVERYLDERGDAIATALGDEDLEWGFRAADPRGDRVVAYPLARASERFTSFEDAAVVGTRERPQIVLTLASEAGERLEAFTSGGRRLSVRVQACENLAHLHEEGLGVSQNAQRASELRARAEELREDLPAGDGVTDPLVAYGQRETRGAASAGDELPWREDEEAAFAAAAEAGKGVAVWFSADWSTSSRALADVLATPEIREAITGAYVPLRFDVSARTADDRAKQEAYDSRHSHLDLPRRRRKRARPPHLGAAVAREDPRDDRGALMGRGARGRRGPLVQ